MSEDVSREPPLVRFARMVNSHLEAFLTPTGSVLLAVTAFLQTSSLLLWLFFGGGASLTVIGQIQSEKKEKSLRQILIGPDKTREQKSAAQKALSEAIGGVGTSLSMKLGLWSPEVCFTIYAHDGDKREFIPIVRGSNNPKLAKKNRTSYPDSQGHLGKVWEQGECSHMRKHERSVRAESLELGFTEEKYGNLTLESRSLKGVRLSKGKQHIGVILRESESPKYIDASNSLLDNIKDNTTLLDLQMVFAASTLLFSDLSERFFEKGS